MKWLFLILLSATVANSATWYVDKAAVGTGSGASWANAWTNLPDVVWTGFAAGDDLQIAQGGYDNLSNPTKAGTAANPITIHLAQDAPHQGHVWITNGMNLYRDWIWVNGAFNTNYTIPTRVADLDGITNNIGLHITTSCTACHGINAASGNRTGLRILWVEFYACGTNASGFPASGESNEDAVHLSDYMTNMVIAYCFFNTNIYGDCINSPRDFGSFGELSIHDCLFYNTGDDVIQINGGFDLYRYKVDGRVWGYAAAHSDIFQTWGNHIRIHHGIIRNWGPPQDEGTSAYCSIGLLQFSNERNGDVLFYNNLFYDQDTNRFANPGIGFTADAWNSPTKYWPTNTITNLVIANNLFVRPGGSVFNPSFTWLAVDASRGTNGIFEIVDCLFANNAILDSYNLDSGMLQGVVASWPMASSSDTPIANEQGPILSSTTRFKIKNNVITGPNFQVSASNTFNNVVEAQAQFAGITGNKTNRPSYVYYVKLSETPEFDFHPSTNDTIVIDAGFDLSAWTNNMPGFGVDLDGVARWQGSTIDIGPYEGFSTNSPAPPDPPAAPTSLRIIGKVTFSGKVILQ